MAPHSGLLDGRHTVQQVLRRQSVKFRKGLKSTYQVIEAVFKALAKQPSPDQMPNNYPYQATLVRIGNA